MWCCEEVAIGRPRYIQKSEVNQYLFILLSTLTRQTTVNPNELIPTKAETDSEITLHYAHSVLRPFVVVSNDKDQGPSNLFGYIS
jgi:hypothetical protein